jgi:hypothetical protein
MPGPRNPGGDLERLINAPVILVAVLGSRRWGLDGRELTNKDDTRDHGFMTA